MLSTVDLLVLASLDQLLFLLEILFIFVTKQATLVRKSTMLSFPLQLVYHCPMHFFVRLVAKIL